MGINPPVITHGVSSGDHLSNISLANFFATGGGIDTSEPRFPPEEISMPNKYGQLIGKDGKKMKATFCLDCRKLLWAGKPTLPLYEFAGNFYWRGLLLMPIYCYTSVDHAVISYSQEEIVLFIKAKNFPSIFGPPLLQLHWKRGDRIIETTNQTHEVIMFQIDEIITQQGIVWVTPIQLLRRDGLQQTCTWLTDMVTGHDIDIGQQEVSSEALQRKIKDGHQECSLVTHHLYLAPGDYVRVLAGKDEGVCGHVIISEAFQLSVLPNGSTNPVSFPLLLDYNSSS